MRATFRFYLLFPVVLLALAACVDDGEMNVDGDLADGDEDGDAEFVDGDSLDGDREGPPAEVIYTTLGRRLVPDIDAYGSACAEPDDRPECDNPAVAVPNMAAYLDAGFGSWQVTPGDGAYTLHAELAARADESAARRSLFRFGQISDVHVTDEESPLRMGLMDSPVIAAVIRPMDMYAEYVLDACVRTLNGVHAATPLGLLLVTGDLTDSAQRNELTNSLTVLSGGEVDPDSGADDDPVPGPGNDPQDAFVADGLAMPWLFVLGNHDVLVLGSFPVGENARTQAVGDFASTGTRDGQSYEIITGQIAPDAAREILDHDQIIETVLDTPGLPEGHGLTAQSLPNNRAYYSYDPDPALPLRFIVLDVAWRVGGAVGKGGTGPYDDGVLDSAQYEDFLLPELARAQADDKLVIVVTHQPSFVLQDDKLPDQYVSAQQFVAALAASPNVILHVSGHSHENRLYLHSDAQGAGAYMEIQVASTLDWPQQMRLFELVDNGDGTLSIFSATLDHQGGTEGLADYARRLALIDRQSGWGEGHAGAPGERNVEIVLPIPPGMADIIAAAPGESLAATAQWAEILP